MKNTISRRNALKLGGIVAIGTPFISKGLTLFDNPQTEVGIPTDPRHVKIKKPLTAIVIGAGNRGNAYPLYSKEYPEQLKIVGVAEPIGFKRERFAEKYNIPKGNIYTTWKHAMQKAKFADIMIITTMDNMHYEPAMAAINLGYDILLEKPIAQNIKQVQDIANLAAEKKCIVGVCHVLRYNRMYKEVKRIIDSGVMGDITNIQHSELIPRTHMQHSYVRGRWRKADETTPMLLSKSCHDLDILYYWLDKKCERVSSFGSLTFFKEANAPKNSGKRCTDCAIEKDCPYSAIKLYLGIYLDRDYDFMQHLDIPDYEKQTILNALKKGNFGRCVWRCDNDVIDHQVVNMEYEDEVTSSFTLGVSENYGRFFRIQGTLGDLYNYKPAFISVAEFKGDKKTVIDVKKLPRHKGGHGGGDFGIMQDFLQAVYQHDDSLLASTISESVESHKIGFKAEESRDTGKTMDV
ncbi:MAG: Gfo/Idh/MocA family oxidoreductase [Melioribacteraceae bacterium]|nr:Gfo/Idh/MocA family oxidoreductase [Melioribacteraceae bacterium]